MKKFENIFTLNHQISFLVPSTKEVDKKCTKEEFEARTMEIAEMMATYFGGATIERVQGYYKTEKGKIVVENINKIVSNCSDLQLESESEKLLNVAEIKRKKWSQESIGIVIDGKMMFI